MLKENPNDKTVSAAGSAARDKLKQDVSPISDDEDAGTGADKSVRLQKQKGGQLTDMTLQFSKLNFRAKNQLSSLAIHDPFGHNFDKKVEVQHIEQDHNERI